MKDEDRKTTHGARIDEFIREDFFGERERASEELRAHAEAVRKERARRAFLDSGGAEGDFEVQYPTLRRRIVEQETIRRVTQRGER